MKKAACSFGWVLRARAVPPRVCSSFARSETAFCVLWVANRPVGSVYSALAVDGTDLIAIGFSPGPQLGATLKALHEVVLDSPEKNDRKILIALAQGMVNGKK